MAKRRPSLVSTLFVRILSAITHKHDHPIDIREGLLLAIDVARSRLDRGALFDGRVESHGRERERKKL